MNFVRITFVRRLGTTIMKYISACFITAALGWTCGCGGVSSSPSQNSAQAPANVANTSKPPAPDAAMVAVPKLIEMAEKDAAGMSDQFKGREMIVIGEVEDAMADLRFYGGFNRKVYCNLASVELDEKKQKIRDLAGDYLMKRRPTMPIVEARGTFDKASVSEFTQPYKGKDVSVFLEKCSIVSVKE